MSGPKRLTAIGGALLAAAVLAGCGGGSVRPKPAELKPVTSTIGVRQAWSAHVSAVNFPLQVHAAGSQVLVAGSDGTVVTLDGATGRELGRARAGAELTGGVGSDGRVAAVVTRDNQVVALENGRKLWSYHLTAQSYTAPLVAGGRVFVLGADRSLTALDGGNGALLWRTQRSAEPLVLRQAGLLMAVGDTLVVGVAGRMIGIDPNTGDVRWETPVAVARGANDVESLVDLVGGVSRQANVVCARAFQAAVGCVDAAAGTLLWSRPASGSTGVSGDGERVYGAESDGRLLAWRADTGERDWAVDSLQWRVLTGTLVLGRSVVVGDSTGLVHLFSRQDGRPVNRLTTDKTGVAATPVALGNTLVVLTRGGGVYGFVPENNK
ncbi:MAG: outer membrane protein assembly factor BamB [Burkholderiaceae bacterium]|jgi:outer membrane assembly lipoprotein YfgL|nr:outer membrane protein assembly factor BamB [Burkholderiaceae bacterium]